MKKKAPQLSRRAFLGGVGASLALPFLPSMWPRQALASTDAPQRLLVFFVPNGVNQADWTPTGTGRDFQLNTIMSPLESLKDDILILSGLANEPAIPDSPGGHAGGTAGILTCSGITESEGANIRASISVDQFAVQQLQPSTTFPSLQLGTDGGSDIGNCDGQYSCAYIRNISWANATTPLSKLVDPQIVFDRMFAGNDPKASRAEKEKRWRYNKSILDYVLEDANSLNVKLGRTDKRKLDQYMTGIRDLEQRITKAPARECGTTEMPGAGLELPDQVRALCDLMVTAYQCDITRYITFMMANGVSNRLYDFLGISGGHHEISHHQNDPVRLADITTITRWEVEQYAYLLNRLKSIEEGEGNILDNSIVMFCSEMSDPDKHYQYDHPIILAGGGGGQITPGRHLVYENQEPVADLHIGLLQALGAQAISFGENGTGPLAGLKEG